MVSRGGEKKGSHSPSAGMQRGPQQSSGCAAGESPGVKPHTDQVAASILLHWLCALGAGLGVGCEPVACLAVAIDLLLPHLPHLAGAGAVRVLAALEAEGHAAGALGLHIRVAVHLVEGEQEGNHHAACSSWDSNGKLPTAQAVLSPKQRQRACVGCAINEPALLPDPSLTSTAWPHQGTLGQKATRWLSSRYDSRWLWLYLAYSAGSSWWVGLGCFRV